MKILVMFALMAGLGSVSIKKSGSAKFQKVPFPVGKETSENRENSESGGSRRVFGGNEAPEGKFPFMVYVFLSDSSCTGCLIKPSWTLTAAHCIPENLEPDWSTFVVGGRANLEEYKKEKFTHDGVVDREDLNQTALGVTEVGIKCFHLHPGYRHENLQHDMALLELEEPMKGPRVGYISLATEKMVGLVNCTGLGWGIVPPSKVMTSTLHYADNLIAGTWPVECSYDYFICVEPSLEDAKTCKGDSGGPLLCDGKVWGVCSFYLGPGSCQSVTMMYFAEVYTEMEWLEEVSRSGRRTTTFLGVLASVLAVLLVSVYRKS